IASEVVIRRQFIGEENRTSRHVLPDFFMQSLFAAIPWDRSPHVAVALKESEHKSLILSASPFDLSLAHLLVHVAGQPTDESLVHFDGLSFTAEFNKRICLRCQSDTMQHEPRGFLCDAKSAAHLIRTDSILGVD